MAPASCGFTLPFRNPVCSASRLIRPPASSALSLTSFFRKLKTSGAASASRLEDEEDLRPVSEAMVLAIEPAFSPNRLPTSVVPKDTRESVLLFSENSPAILPRMPLSILAPPSVFSRLPAPSAVEPCLARLPSSAGSTMPSADWVLFSGSPRNSEACLAICPPKASVSNSRILMAIRGLLSGEWFLLYPTDDDQNFTPGASAHKYHGFDPVTQIGQYLEASGLGGLRLDFRLVEIVCLSGLTLTGHHLHTP